MTIIYKYMLASHETIIELPMGSKILCAQYQDDDIYLWVWQYLEITKKEKRKFSIFLTGVGIPNGKYDYIDTVQIDDIVYHIFEVLDEVY